MFLLGSQRKPWTKEKINEVINRIRTAMKSQHRTPIEYYWTSKYDVMNTANEELLIFRRKSSQDPTVHIIPREEYFRVLKETHISCGHGGRDKMLHAIKSKFYIPKKAIEIFIALCPTCETKKNIPKKGIVTRPIISHDFNIRGQVDLMDFQSCPDDEYKWLLNYQDNATKFLNLRPLKTKKANEVAIELMKIFTIFGAPNILQSDNGREFTAKVIEELTAMWPGCKIVHGSPRRPQTQGSVERSNQDVENMLRSWMSDNKSTNWSLGCYHVQYQKNISFHRIIGRSPYKALFGKDPKAGLSSSAIPPSILLNIKSEEQLKNLCEQEFSNNSQQITNKNVTCNETDRKANTEEPENFEKMDKAHAVYFICDLNEKEHEDKNATCNKTDQNANTEPECFEEMGKTQFKQITYSDSNNSDENEIYVICDITENECEDKNITCNETDRKTNREMERFEEIENVQPNLTCVVCHNACTGAHNCRSCKNFVHAICGLSEKEDEGYGSEILCFLCNSECNIQFQRNEAHKGIKRAAEKMIDNTAKKLPPLTVGVPVYISVPKVDRGPLDTKNIKGKIVDYRNGVYRVGTNSGTLKNWFARHELQISSENYNDDISDVAISLREAVSYQSMFGGQGFQKCICKPAQKQCCTNRCACFKKKMLCGSKCHSSLSCVNK